MESTPDSGVDMRNDVVAPLLAPCLRSDTAAGKTPQDHKGIGIPKKEALSTETNRPRPRCLATEPGLRNTRNNPATIRPNTMYTDESKRRCQDAEMTFTIKFNLFQPFRSIRFQVSGCSKPFDSAFRIPNSSFTH
jgi:hypothetical protein